MPTGITPPVAGERITVVMMSAYIAKSPRCTGKIVRVIFLQIDLYQRQTATMSALGHKQTFAVHKAMSAVPNSGHKAQTETPPRSVYAASQSQADVKGATTAACVPVMLAVAKEGERRCLVASL